MTPEQLDRVIVALESLAESFEYYVERQFPPRVVNAEAEVWRQGESETKQPQSPEEYKAFPEDEPGRFEKLFSKATAT